MTGGGVAGLPLRFFCLLPAACCLLPAAGGLLLEQGVVWLAPLGQFRDPFPDPVAGLPPGLVGRLGGVRHEDRLIPRALLAVVRLWYLVSERRLHDRLELFPDGN